MQTCGPNPENCIYLQKRCHISLGLVWQGRWHEYRPDAEYRANNAKSYDQNESPGCFDVFRYLLLKPTGGFPDWTHPIEASDTIPFLSPNARDAFKSRRLASQCERDKSR
jgi:hypothetical protein